MLSYGLARDAEDRPDLFTRNRRKVFQEVVDTVSRLEIVQQGSNRNTRAGEARGSGEYVGVARHRVLMISHTVPRADCSAIAPGGRGWTDADNRPKEPSRRRKQQVISREQTR